MTNISFVAYSSYYKVQNYNESIIVHSGFWGSDPQPAEREILSDCRSIVKGERWRHLQKYTGNYHCFHLQCVSKETQHFWSWISQRWFDQINCPFGMLLSIAIQFYRVQNQSNLKMKRKAIFYTQFTKVFYQSLDQNFFSKFKKVLINDSIEQKLSYDNKKLTNQTFL